jgi:hypothetical protein
MLPYETGESSDTVENLVFLALVCRANYEDHRISADPEIGQDKYQEGDKCGGQECHGIQLGSAGDTGMNGPEQVKHVNRILDCRTESQNGQGTDGSEGNHDI